MSKIQLTLVLVVAGVLASACSSPTTEAPGAIAEADDQAAYSEFTTRAVGFGDAFGIGLESLGTAAVDFDLDALAGTAASQHRLLDIELAWLESHPPAACYADLHARWQRALEMYNLGMTGMEAALVTLDLDSLNESTATVVDANELLGAATDAISLVDCA